MAEATLAGPVDGGPQRRPVNDIAPLDAQTTRSRADALKDRGPTINPTTGSSRAGDASGLRSCRIAAPREA